MTESYLCCNWGKDNSALRESETGGSSQDVGLANRGEAEKPEHRLGHGLQNVHPHLQGGRINLVELVEVAVYDGIARQVVLRPRAHNELLRHFLASRCLVVQLKGKDIRNTPEHH